jgi:hypothetical protein
VRKQIQVSIKQEMQFVGVEQKGQVWKGVKSIKYALTVRANKKYPKLLPE